MHTLQSYVYGRWHRADGAFVPLHDPSSGREIARASTRGVDFGRVLEHARSVGGPALRAMTFAERGAMLKAVSRVLRAHRDELLELSRRNNGTTEPDGAFDIDGGGGALAYYARLGKTLGERHRVSEGEVAPLAGSDTFSAGHLLLARPGAAVHINAFNFPVWGLSEKAACAWLAGMPVVAKPATATALVAERAAALMLEAEALPDGALQLLCGNTGDLLDHLRSSDVVAFTGSAATADHLRGRVRRPGAYSRFNVEADSLNAAVLAPGSGPEDATFRLFTREVVREITQKSGQKCTAVRRILVPLEDLERAIEALVARLARVVTGDPADPEVRMGPLATAQQLASARQGLSALRREAEVVFEGSAPEGPGYFFPPTLLRCDDPRPGSTVHEIEVFAPVATVLPYDGSPEEAAALVGHGGGTLVTSVYVDDEDWLDRFATLAGGITGRLYVGSAAAADGAPGSGAAFPHCLHGGPGRAGGGEELGGLRGVMLYLQRLAVQGARPAVERLLGG